MTPGRPDAASPLRVARPSADLARARAFWVDGLGLDELWSTGPSTPEHPVDGGHALLMVGWPDAAWHLELVEDPEALAVSPSGEEDLLVLYVGEPVDPALVERLVEQGGTVVPARNPYWDVWGTTVRDPDGHRLVLSRRSWDR